MLVKFQNGELEFERELLVKNSEYVERWTNSALTKDTSILSLELFCREGLLLRLDKK